MFTSIQTLLFATNLSEQCRPALEATRFFSERYGVGVVLLHVIDQPIPTHLDEYFKGLVGDSKWEKIKVDHEQSARETLIGKMSSGTIASGTIAEKVVRNYCIGTETEDAGTNLNWREVVVYENNIGQAIVDQAKQQNCELIILGSKKGFLGGNNIGQTIKHVLRKSRIPAMVVPARSEKG